MKRYIIIFIGQDLRALPCMFLLLGYVGCLLLACLNINIFEAEKGKVS